MASFTLKPDVPAWTRTLPVGACATLAALAFVAFLPGLAELPALQGDEAAAGLVGDGLARGGAWSWFGGEPGRGPLHQLLVAASFVALGPSVWSLRVVGAASNALAVGLYAWVTGQLWGRRTAVLATLALVTAPCFWLAARTATEHTALSALFAAAAVTCLLVARSPPTLDPATRHRAAGRSSALAAGALLGLGTWNHVLFFAVPATLLAWALGHWGLGALRRAEVLWPAFGWACVEAGPLSQLGRDVLVHGDASAAIAHLRALPGALGEVWQGNAVALRVFGRVGVGQAPWAQILLGLAFVGLLAAATDVGLRAGRARVVLAASMGLSVCTAVLSPAHAERHYVLPLLTLPWVAAEGLAALARPLGARGRSLSTAVCALAVGLQAAQGLVHVAAPLRAGVARASAPTARAFNAPSPLAGDTRGLYEALVHRGIAHVQAHRSIAAPLRFYDLAAGRLVVDELPGPLERAAQALAAPDVARTHVPLLTYAHEWRALRGPLQRAEAARGLQAPLAEVASLGAFTLVRRSQTTLD